MELKCPKCGNSLVCIDVENKYTVGYQGEKLHIGLYCARRWATNEKYCDYYLDPVKAIKAEAELAELKARIRGVIKNGGVNKYEGLLPEQGTLTELWNSIQDENQGKEAGK